jgi:hypothetical protein
MTDRAVHAPEHQTGMPTPPRKPGCWTDVEPVSVRAPQFWDQGRACGCARDPQTWATALRHTPTCFGCARARRGLALNAGVAG